MDNFIIFWHFVWLISHTILQDGHPPLGWQDTAAYLVLPVLLVISQYVSMELMKPPQVKNKSIFWSFSSLFVSFLVKLGFLLADWWSISKEYTSCFQVSSTHDWLLFSICPIRIINLLVSFWLTIFVFHPCLMLHYLDLMNRIILEKYMHCVFKTFDLVWTNQLTSVPSCFQILIYCVGSLEIQTSWCAISLALNLFIISKIISSEIFNKIKIKCKIFSEQVLRLLIHKMLCMAVRFTNNVLSTAQQVWLRKLGGAKPVVNEDASGIITAGRAKRSASQPARAGDRLVLYFIKSFYLFFRCFKSVCTDKMAIEQV